MWKTTLDENGNKTTALLLVELSEANFYPENKQQENLETTITIYG